jgi:hypothetical protein
MRAAATFLVGGAAFQLGGCDPTVKSTILTGLKATTSTLTETFVTAFFASLVDEEDGTLTTTP